MYGSRQPRIDLAFPLALLLGGAAGFGYLSNDAAPTSVVAAMSANCSIKGNISVDTGERIYHAPGQKFYDETIIRPEFGKRWFCSEAEARQAGWRKAR